MTKGLKMKDKWAEKNNVCPPWVETKKKMLVVCKVVLRTIILRDNIIRKHW